MIIHYKQGTTDFLGMDNIVTPLVIQAEIEREINGIFNAELLIIKDSEMEYDKIKSLDFLKIPTPGGDQLFRIVDIDDTATHIITVFCKHILFDLQKRLIKDTFIQQRNGTQALQQILNSLDEPTEFMAFSDITTLNNLRLVRTKGIDAILGGNQDNYLIERYKGEIDVDNFRIKLLKRLGTDKGYEIREGKNLTGYNYKEDSSELCTRLMPVLFDGKLIPETYVDSPNINKYDIVHTNTVKFDDIKLKERNDDGTIKPDDTEEGYINEGYNTESDMFIEARKRCKKLFEEGLDKVRVQAAVNFVDLSKTEQYKDFQFLHRLDLGDTVHFILEKYKLRVAERIVAYRYNPLTKEYNELELGHAQDSIFSSGGGINGSGGSNSGDIGSGDGEGTPNIDFDKWYEQIIKDVTNQIHNGMKDSYVLVRANEILIMDTKDISTAQKVWRWNRGGLGFSNNGYNGTYSTAMTSNGQFVINEITCQKFVGDLIDVGTLQADRLSVEAKGEIVKGLVTQSSLNVAMDNIDMKVSSSGGGNLFENSGFNPELEHWSIGSYEWQNQSNQVTVWTDHNEWILSGTRAVTFICNGVEEAGELFVDQRMKVKQNQDYTFSCLIAGHRSDGGAHIYAGSDWRWLGHGKLENVEGYTGGKDVRQWKKLVFTFNSENETEIGVRLKMTKSIMNGHIWITQPMLNEGTLAQPWIEKSPSTSYVEQQLTADSITNKVQTQIGAGGKINVTSMILDKSGIETSHGGYKTRVADGWSTSYDLNGDWVNRIGRHFDVYSGRISGTEDYIGGLRCSYASGKKRMGFLADADTQGHSFAYTVGGGGSEDPSYQLLSLPTSNSGLSNIFNPWDFGFYRCKNLSMNYDNYATATWINGMYLQHNQIDVDYHSSNLILNWHRGSRCNNPSKAYVNDGTGNGGRGIIYVKSVDARSAMEQRTITDRGDKKSLGVTAMKDFIEDVFFGTIGESGTSTIVFNQDFVAQADTSVKYHVQVTGYDGGTFKIERFEDRVKLTGTPGEEFSIKVTCFTRNQLSAHIIPLVEDTMKDEVYKHNNLSNLVDERLGKYEKAPEHCLREFIEKRKGRWFKNFKINMQKRDEKINKVRVEEN